MSEDGLATHGGNKAAYTIAEFCASYGIGRSLAYEEISSGRLRTRKVGRRTLVLFADAQAWARALPDGRAA